ncbi:MAG: hypothetical protein R2745_20950 [Vicinamibacterales bacterium]
MSTGAPPAVVPGTMSLVITIVDGHDTLRGMLLALRAQRGAPPLQILAPYDDSRPDIGAMAGEFPEVEFFSIGAVQPAHPIASAGGQHELFDRRRAAGLKRATGDLVAILEDRAPPRPDWCATMARLHAELPHAVIGGAIESASADRLNWAFYACDFSRYAPPFEAGPRDWVSDVNVCYKRRAVELTRDLWHTRFHEPEVHWRLIERGETLYLTPEAVVDYTTPYTSLLGVLPERFQWGRLFGYIRAKNVSTVERLKFIAAGPLLPLVLFRRHAAAQARRGQSSRFWQAAPVMLPLLMAWTAGEVWGYVTRRG